MSSQLKQHIQQAIQSFQNGSLRDNGLYLLDTLGYRSERQIALDNTPTAFLDAFDAEGKLDQDKALLADWIQIDLLFQLTDHEIQQSNQMILFDSAGKVVDNAIIESYLFVAVALRGDRYTRTQLAQATRELNKLFPMPVMLLFQHGGTLTLSIINRRLHKRDRSKDVLEKVTLIKDIRIADPHRAHVEILFDLSLAELYRVHNFVTFVALHQAWQKTLDSSELNKKFFKEVADWYFWAVGQVTFPEAAGPAETRNATSVIRLITRLIFVWFLKEKGVVPDALFSRRTLDDLLTWDDPNGSTYYKAILQNLFFATLNQEMNTPDRPDNRKFRGTRQGGQDQHYMIHNVYRYARYFQDPDAALALFAGVPFLNGGLFECLDRRADDQPVRIDGFSDRDDSPLVVPDGLFFGPEQEIDLNDVYGTTGKRYRVRGLIDTLSRYKFTIAENTPIEEEIALDPELLGKVFENLLAAYNPETDTTARKQTGSFYTPREIVNYMVDESLLAYLETKLAPADDADADADVTARLRHLFAYNEEPHQFSEAEVTALIDAIDHVNILDPACGSGAFPMGILHKLVFILAKLDPHNARWKAQQIAPIRKAIHESAAIPDGKLRAQVMADLEQKIAEIEEAFARNELDYGRKLYLIENCIYGVDIQPIAVQIAKLRFFISLIVDQRLDAAAANRGILPLPNLETKFVAANTLLGIEKPQQLALRNPEITAKENELADVRSRHFRARTPRTKEKYRALDRQLRAEIGELLRRDGFPNETTEKLARWDPYNQNASADFFDPEWMFGLENGFDVVIGNPPYVRQEKIKPLKPALKRQYTCYTGTADLYVYFIEGAVRLLGLNGVLCYICSNKYFRAGYGKALRAFLGDKTTIRQLIDFGDAPVFTAIAYPSILLLQKAPPDGSRLHAFNWEPGPPVTEFEPIYRAQRFSMPQTALAADGWRLEQREVRALLEKLRQAGKPLGEYVNGRFYYGIKTGLNEAFVVDRATRDRLIAEHPSSAELLMPFLRGRDVKRWQVTFAEEYLIKIESSVNKQHSWSGRPEREAEQVFARCYPAIQAHFEAARERLISRYDQGQYFWELRACAYWSEFETPKIVYPDIAQNAEFALDDSGYYLANTMYFIPTEKSWLVGLLNSQAVYWFYTQLSTKIRGEFVRYFTQYVSEIPVPISKDTKKLGILSEQILALKQANPTADVSTLEHEIDQHVYALYGLTPPEIAIVEGREAPPAAVPPPVRARPRQTTNVSETFVVSETPDAPASSSPAAPPLIFTGQPPQGTFSEKLKRVETLAKQASPAAIQELVAVLADDNLTLRWRAAAALRKIGGPQVAGVLHAFIAHTDSATARAEAEKLLVDLRT